MPRRSRRGSSRGATSVEYALLIALIAIAIVAAVTLLGNGTAGLFQRSCDSFSQHSEGTAC